MANPGSHKHLFLMVAFALVLIGADYLSAKGQPQSESQPAKVGEVDTQT